MEGLLNSFVSYFQKLLNFTQTNLIYQSKDYDLLAELVEIIKIIMPFNAAITVKSVDIIIK